MAFTYLDTNAFDGLVNRPFDLDIGSGRLRSLVWRHASSSSPLFGLSTIGKKMGSVRVASNG